MSTAGPRDGLIVITDLEPDDRRALRVLATSVDAASFRLVGATLLDAPLKTFLARRLLTQMGLKDVAVVQGLGGSPQSYPAARATLAARTYAHEGVGIVPEAERERGRTKPRRSEALAKVIVRTLSKAREVDIVLLAPAQDLQLALQRSPSLANRIRCVHMMGGWLTAKGGQRRSSYNWTMAPQETAALLANKDLSILLYSSHVIRPSLGTSVNRNSYPKLWRTIYNQSLNSDSLFEDMIASATWDRHIVGTFPPLRDIIGPHVGRNFSPADPAVAVGVVNRAFVQQVSRYNVRLRANDFDPMLGYLVEAERSSKGNVALVEALDKAAFKAGLKRGFAPLR